MVVLRNANVNGPTQTAERRMTSDISAGHLLGLAMLITLAGHVSLGYLSSS
jgi:hypothetical protein